MLNTTLQQNFLKYRPKFIKCGEFKDSSCINTIFFLIIAPTKSTLHNDTHTALKGMSTLFNAYLELIFA